MYITDRTALARPDSRRSPMPRSEHAARHLVAASFGFGLLSAACHSGPKPGKPAGPAAAGDSVDVGYGTQSRRDLTGSVSSLAGDDTRRGNPTSMADMIEGRFPGVEVRRLPSGGV